MFSTAYIQPQVESRFNRRVVDGRIHDSENQSMANSEIGRLIRDRLRAMGKTQGWLAERMGVSDNAVSKWVKSGSIARAKIVQLAGLLGVDPAALLDESRSRGGLHAGESASPYEPGADLWRRYEEASPAARLVVDLVLNRRTMAAATNETLQAALKTALLAAGEAPADGELGAGKTKAA